MAMRWPESGPRLIYERRMEAGAEPLFSIHFHEGAGYLLRHELFGTFLVDGDGSHIAAAPGALTSWRWQRFLIGQVLPLAALLRGREAFHSSAVELGGFSVMFVGPSGSGKSTLAVGMSLEGAGFLADDVVAISGLGGAMMAHPGAAVASLDLETVALMRTAWKTEVGVALGQEGDEARILVDRTHRSSPVRLVYLIQPRGDRATPSIEPVEDSNPRRLLGSTYNAYVDTSDRLMNTLSTCAGLSRTARVYTLEAGDGNIRNLIFEVKQHAQSAAEDVGGAPGRTVPR